MTQTREEKAAVLIAWANDEKARAQYFYSGEWWDYGEDGHKFPPPVFNGRNWRIKPPPKPDEVRYVALNWRGQINHIAQVQPMPFWAEWDVTLKLTRNGETGEVTAEVLK